MTPLRHWLLLFSLAALGAAAACSGGRTPTLPASSGAISVATTVPLPAATATSVALPLPSGTPLTVNLPAVSGGAAGSTLAISATSARPTSLPSAFPQSPLYVTVTLPSGATMAAPPSLNVPAGPSVTGFGAVQFATQMAALGRMRQATATATPSTLQVIYTPDQRYAGLTYEASQVLAIASGPGLVPFEYGVVPGSSTQIFLDTIDSTPSSSFSALVPTSVATNVTFAPASGSCTPYSNLLQCVQFTLGLNAQIGTQVTSFPLVVYNLGLQYGAIATIDIAAARTNMSSFGDFNEFPASTATAAPIAVLPNSFTWADISLPAVSPSTSPAPLKITTSVAPIDPNVNLQIEKQLILYHIASINFSYPEQLTFGAVGNLTSDFCFGPTFPTFGGAYGVYSYVGTTLTEHIPTVTNSDATCPTSTHLSMPSNFGTAPIPAGTNFGLVIVAK